MSKRYEYTYTAADYADPQQFELRSNFEPEFPEEIAELAAEDYFHNHDGWEDSWPRTFTIFHEGKRLGAFKVDMEAVPHFYTVVS